MSDATKPADITRDTTIAALLRDYPQLENLLVVMVPAWGRLRTTALRHSVAENLTLARAAATADMPEAQLVLGLRRAAGLPETTAAEEADSAPAWAKSATVKKTIDARPLLAQGVHPKDIVVRELQTLQPGEALLLIAPFVPGPLIEIGKSMGLETWTRQRGAGHVETFFGKR